MSSLKMKSNGGYMAYVVGIDPDPKTALKLMDVLGRGGVPNFGPIALADISALCTLGPAAILSPEYAPELEKLDMRAAIQLTANAAWIPHLRPYDPVVLMGDDHKIVSVAGLTSPDELARRPYLGAVGVFNAARKARPPQHMMPLDAFGSHAMRVIQLLAPMGFGQKVVIRSPGEAGKTYLVIDLVKTLIRMQEGMPNLHIVPSVVNERTEDYENMTAKVFQPGTFDPLRVHRTLSSMDNLNLTAVYYTAITTLSIALRLVEAGQHVAATVDSISRIAEALTGLDHLNKTGQTGLVSGGLSRDALVQTRAMAALGGDFSHIVGKDSFHAGTMTVFATALSSERAGKGGSDPSEAAYSREVAGTAHTGTIGLVKLTTRSPELATRPWIDVFLTSTRFHDTFVPLAHLEEMAEVRTRMASMDAPEAQATFLHGYAFEHPEPKWLVAERAKVKK